MKKEKKHTKHFNVTESSYGMRAKWQRRPSERREKSIMWKNPLSEQAAGAVYQNENVK